MKNLATYGYEGEIWPINPGRPDIFGTRCYRDVAELPGMPELGVVVVAAHRALPACEELIAAGVRELLVVSNGFKETGTPEGIAAEANLVRMGAAAGVRVVGPNGVGYARMNDHLCAIAEPVPQTLRAGDVSLISHSGALLSGGLEALHLDGLGIDRICSIGNGAAFDLAAALKDAGGGGQSRVVCAIVESLPGRAQLSDALAVGKSAGVHYVFLLLGQSEAGKGVAASHTGAVIGDGRLARSWLESEGVIIVESLDEMARTAAILTAVGRPNRAAGMMIVSGSGGSAGLAADACARYGVPLTQISEATITALRDNLPPGSYIGNPLDMVAGMPPERREAIYKALGADPAVGIILNPFPITFPDEGPDRAGHRAGLEDGARRYAQTGKRYMLVTVQQGALGPFADHLRTTLPVSVLSGLELTVRALGNVFVGEARPQIAATPPPETGDRFVLGEGEARLAVRDAGLSLVPGGTAASPAEAVALSTTMAGPWVVKLGNPGVAHKGRVGGVKVGLCSAAAVEAACHEIATSAVRHGIVTDAANTIFLVQQMAIGPELLVGAVRDAVAGDSITVGFGGWAAEAGHLFFTAQLPADAGSLLGRIEASQLQSLLAPAQQQALAGMLDKVALLFSAPSMAHANVIEINPVILSGNDAVCADVLIAGETPPVRNVA